MVSPKWTTSEAVWIEEIDDQHKEIFAAVGRLQEILSASGSLREILKTLEHLANTIVGHFAHEERLMRASRYRSLAWHTQQHDAARRKVRQLAHDIGKGDRAAGVRLVEYLTKWLRNHTRIADRMMGAHLRNARRSVAKLTFRAGTKAAQACAWTDSAGNKFDPLGMTNGL